MLWKIIKFLHNCKTVSKDKLQKEDIQQMAENYQKLDLFIELDKNLHFSEVKLFSLHLTS